MRFSKIMFGCAASSLLASAALAQPMLNASMTVDNEFTAYITQDPTVNGTQFLAGSNWQATSNGSVSLENAGTYYLHIVATDQGLPAAFIGQFSLSNSDATFINGTQSLLTNTIDWQCSTEGWNSPFVAPVDLGSNAGGTVWGTRPGISTDARFIWHSSNASVTYFTTAIRVVPAPGAGLVILGSLGVLTRRRR